MLFSSHVIAVLVSLLGYVVITRVGRQRRTPTAALAWVLLMLVMPYVALPVFLMFGTRKLLGPDQRQPGRLDPAAVRAASRDGSAAQPLAAWAAELNASMGMPAPVHGGDAAFQLEGGPALETVLRLLDGARRSIEVCTYVLGRDEQADRIIMALCTAARRGVRVRLLLDGVGCLRVGRSQYLPLLAAGVHVRRYMPLLHNPVRGRTNLRNHRKLLVVDQHCLWAGGRNLAEEYFLGNGREPAWLDISFCISGPLVADALALFETDWQVAHQLPARYRLAARQARRRLHRAPGGGMPAESTAGAPTAMPSPATRDEQVPVEASLRNDDAGADGRCDAQALLAQLLPSGPDRFDDTVYALLLGAAFHARRQILAITPYFVPDEGLLTAWCLAARRGVRVRLLVPMHSNHRLADIARMRALRQLVQVGGEVHLYPRMLHAKAVVVDDSLALAGSLNLDSRSFFLNYEAMVAFYRQKEISELTTWIEERMQLSPRQDGQPPGVVRDVFEGMVRAVAYQL